MSKMKLIGCVTPNYLNRTKDWFDTVSLMKSCDVRVVLLNFNQKTDPEQKLENQYRSAYPNITFAKLDLPPTHSHLMIQDGSFLDAFPDLESLSLVCLVDMDVYFQRDFTDSEIWWFNEASGRSVQCYFNGGPDDTLKEEAKRIDLDPEWVDKHAKDDLYKSCMNCGVMIADVDTWKEIRKSYGRHYEEFYNATPHRSRCQFLLNWCWREEVITVRILDDCIHQHGHFGLQNVCRIENGKYKVGDKEVVICHHLNRL